MTSGALGWQSPKIALPMVAPGPDGLGLSRPVVSNSALKSLPQPKKPWDLIDPDAHQSWSLTIDAGVQMIAGKGFVKSSPPTLDSVDTSTLDAAERLQLLAAMRVRDDEMNTDVYTYVISNIAPDARRTQYITTHFKPTSTGVACCAG